MGIFDKIKSTFFYDSEEEKSVKKEVIKVEIPAPVKEKKETNESVNTEEESTNKKEDNVFFKDDDFLNIDKNLARDFDETRPIKRIDSYNENSFDNKSLKKDYNQGNKDSYLSNYNNFNYGKAKEKSLDDLVIKHEEKKFSPTPVISPVYGVLDKNYHKEDIVNKEDKVVKETDEFTIDDLRQKAYGTLEDELEKTMSGIKSRVAKNENNENLLDDLEVEMKQTADAIDLLDKKYNEFDETQSDNYVQQKVDDLDLLEQQLTSHNLKEELVKPKNKEEKHGNTKDDELFDLIDSLYERSDN